jgi:4-amino-4-deoxy-L-arabinose transferase-like glycosyltransferase
VTHGPAELLLRVPVADLVLLAVVIGAGLSIARGFVTARRGLARSLPLIAALVFGTAAVWARSRGALAALGSQLEALSFLAVLLGLHLAFAEGGADTRASSAPFEGFGKAGGSRPRTAWDVCLPVALLLAGTLLFWRLPTFASSTLVWESPVTEGFGNAFHSRVGIAAYAVRQLTWNDGLVSNGQDSLLYGAPTYALMRTLGFSTLSLRIFAVIAALLFVVAVWALARRHFGAAVGGVAAIVVALNTYTIFYGKYGTSLAATLLLCTVAAVAAGLLVRAESPPWWLGPAAGLALFVATLHYSTGRLVIVVILLSLVPSIIRAAVRRLRRPLVAFAGFAIVLAGILSAQLAVRAQHFFFHARGEQLLTMLDQPDYVRDFLTRDVPAFTRLKAWAVRAGLVRDVPNAAQRAPDGWVSPERLSTFDKFEVAFKILAVTVPQCNRLLSPFAMIDGSQQGIFDDPPPIKPYFAPLAAFTLLGLALSVRRFWRWEHAVLLAWFAITVIPVLLTTRFDAHRIVLSVVPLILWTALGAFEAGRVMGRLGVPRVARAVLGCTLAALLLVGTASVVLRQEVDRGEQRRVLEACELLPGSVVVGALIDHRQRAWIELGLLERARRNRAAEGLMLDASLREDLAHPEDSWPADLLDRTQAVCARATLILAPAADYRTAAERLRERGIRVRELRQGDLVLWLIPQQMVSAARGSASSEQPR